MKRSWIVLGIYAFALIGEATNGVLTAAELVRGPYLQSATPDSIIIRWRTDTQTESVVRYGFDTNNFPFSASDLTLTNEHIVPLLGLTPATTYYYSVGSVTQNFAQGVDCQFITTPDQDNTGPTRVWVIGDSGGFALGYTNVLAVRDAYSYYAAGRPTDCWLLLGDNAYDSGTDDQYQSSFFNVFSELLQQVAPWPTIGNHDTYAVPPGGRFPYLDIFSFPTNGEAGGIPSGTEDFYSFDYANIHFICLDSMTENRATNGLMATWLSADLAATTNQWRIAFWHHAPYSKGSHDSDAAYEVEMIEMRQNIVPILEAGGIDLVLSGHGHNYERSYLLRGHYGYSTNLSPAMILDQGSGREDDTGAYIKPTFGPYANQGTVYVVAGNSSVVEPPRFGHHPAMFIDELQLGSLVLEINSNRLDLTYLRETGAIDDSFTIIKGNPEPLRICTFNLQGGNTIIRWKSLPGYVYRVETTLSLQSPFWSPTGSKVMAIGATTSWTNRTASVATSFYRVKQLWP